MDVPLFSLVNFCAKSLIFLSVLIHNFLIHSERVLLVLACIYCPFFHFALHCTINPSSVFSRAFSIFIHTRLYDTVVLMQQFHCFLSRGLVLGEFKGVLG